MIKVKARTEESIKRASELLTDARRYFVNKGINRLKNDFILIEGSALILTNNEIKDIIKVIKF